MPVSIIHFALIYERIFNHVDPLWGIRNLEGGADSEVDLVDKIDLHHRLMQINSLDASVGIYLGDVFGGNTQLQPGDSAAVKHV